MPIIATYTAFFTCWRVIVGRVVVLLLAPVLLLVECSLLVSLVSGVNEIQSRFKRDYMHRLAEYKRITPSASEWLSCRQAKQKIDDRQ